MRLPLRILGSRIRNKIILPYLLLVVCLVIAMTFVTIRLTVGALQERLDDRLVEAGQVSSDVLVSIEDQQISQLRALVFTQGAAEALRDHDPAELDRLFRPQWVNAGLYTLVAFDSAGQPLLSWQRPAGSRVDAPPEELPQENLAGRWIVQQIIQNHSDALGDKFSAFHDGRLYTAAPVKENDRLIGGIMVGLPLDVLLERLQRRSQASATTFYDSTGRAVATTQVLAANAVVPAIPAEVLAQLRAEHPADQPLHVQSTVALNGREHQLAYSPLQIRRAMNGYFSVAISRHFIIDAWASERLPLAGFAMLLVVAVCWIGLSVARQITRPLNDLVSTAREVTQGNLQQRSAIDSRDELGVLARSLNQMTERLLHLYETSRALSVHTQIGGILAQTNSAVQRLVPGAVTLAVLDDPDGWRVYLGDSPDPALRDLDRTRIADAATMLTLIERGAKPFVADEAQRNALALPAVFEERCYAALTVQGQHIGLLALLHHERGVFGASSVEPLAAVASMAATALHNARLYLQVQQEGERRQVILESIADGVLVCDADRNVELMNTAAAALLDIYDWHERRYHFNHLPLSATAEAGSLLLSEAQSETRYEAHGQILRASSARLPGSGSMQAGEVIVLHNISAEVALDHAKTDLIAMISHELRTPLTGILGAVDLLSKGFGGQLSSLQRELADAALRQSRAMSVLIDKAVLVAHLEAGGLELNLQPTILGDVIEATTFLLGEEASKIELQIDVAEDVPLVLADPSMLKIALQQLLDNAIKYGAGAPVQIVARQHGDGVELLIQDEGPGIPAAELPHLFRRLQRNAGSNNSTRRGLGLGLVITRELIERHGGLISVQSELGQGSQFRIVLPGADSAQLLAA
jgi:signal transduction histidine kinase/HAMP domain-containing protein